MTSTYAGTAGSFGSANGAALTVARFNQPNGVAVDSTGVVYVADTFSHTIRRITVAGEVTTLAGLAGSSGSTDGTGAGARFNQPNGIAVDTAGNVYIADTQNRTIRRSGATTAPTITAQPVNTAVTQGQPVMLSVVVSGAPTPTFVWRKNGTTISGATDASYVVASAQTSHVGSYDVVISNYLGSVTSHAVALTVNTTGTGTAPTISGAPQNLTANVGGTVTLNVVATGSLPLIFQWKFSGQPIPGAIAATLTLANLQLANSGSYTVTVSNGAGSVTSTAANVVVTNVPGTPVITAQPTGQVTTAGADVTLTVSVAGDAPLSFQWHKDGTALSGATASTLTLTQVALAHAGAYTVRVTNGVGSVMSEIASVTVVPVGTSASHAQLGANFVPGTTVTISNVLSYVGTAESLGWEVILPAGWAYVASSGNEGDVKPRTGDTMLLSWAWTTPAASPVAFSYSVSIPASGPRSYSVASLGIVRQAGVAIQLVARPDPLNFYSQQDWHSADTDHNSRVSLLELTRVIELYNVRRDTTRTGSYGVAVTTSEDGFASEPTRSGGAVVTLTNYHSADTNRDGRFSLLELTRVIELYNVRSGSVRTGAYRLLAGSEDGFAPGPEVIAYTSP